MYTSYIGKKFLQYYNEREGKNYSSKAFFEEIYFPIFFTDNSHLIHVGNSPFFQKPKDEDIQKMGNKTNAQFNNLKEKIKNKEFSGSTLVGFAAEDIDGSTTGQISSLNLNYSEDDVYTSWIGEALSIGISGGFLMLLDELEILWILYEGWVHYRRFLTQTPNVKDKQIETWNGHWLYNRNINPSIKENAEKKLAIPTIEWVKLIFFLAKNCKNKNIVGYCYNLSQMNTTLGFINIYLKEVNHIFEIRDALFIKEDSSILSDNEINNLITFYTFKKVTQLGYIGLHALEPEKLRDYMPKNSFLHSKGNDFVIKDEKSHYNYKIYKIWIMAILNKTELLNFATAFAKLLLEFEQSKTNERGKTGDTNLVKEVLECYKVKLFIDKLTELNEKNSTKKDLLKSLVSEVLVMQYDVFPLFITLVKFEYSYLKN